MAEGDGMIARSPVFGMKQRRREKPIRLTPTLADFHAIVGNIRAQKFADTANESADFIEFLGLAGLGQAEAAALKWADISIASASIARVFERTSPACGREPRTQVRSCRVCSLLLETVVFARVCEQPSWILTDSSSGGRTEV
ncbi:MAG: hypothetical protein WCE49_02545 [Terrimicrobiaceae bacterium]